VVGPKRFAERCLTVRVLRVDGHAPDQGGKDLIHGGFGDGRVDADLFGDIADRNLLEKVVKR
jgi:hypothetical protein